MEINNIELLSPKGVWKDFDPLVPELETTLLKETVRGDCIISEYYFTGRAVADGKSRVYAVLARPNNPAKKYPAVIIAGDINKGINTAELESWADEGYVALSIDYQGEAEDKPRFTVYPKSIEYANLKKSGRHLSSCDTNARETCFYEWAVCHRRAITFLQSLPFVAAENVCIIGMRGGGSFLWQVIATDTRLLAAAMILTGWDDWRKDEVLDEERERWFAGVAPQAYAMFVQTPVLFMSATNDRVCNMDNVYNILTRIPENVETRLTFSPRLNNYVGYRQAKTLKLWFKHNMKTGFIKAPIISSLVKDKKLFVNAVADCSEEIKSIHIYYACNNENPASRNWESFKLEAAEQSDVFTAEIPVPEGVKSLYIFANILYKSGALVSSNLLSRIPELDKVAPSVFKSRIMYNNQEGTSTFFSEQPDITVDYIRDDNPIKMTSGPGGIKGVTCTAGSLATYKLGDKRYIKTADTIILCDITSAAAQTVTICVVTDVGTPAQKAYKYSTILAAGNWHKLKLMPADFKCSGRSLDSFLPAELIYFETAAPVVINNVLLL